MLYFLVFNAVFTGFMAFVFQTNTVLNICVKIYLTLLFLTSVFHVLSLSGYILKL